MNAYPVLLPLEAEPPVRSRRLGARCVYFASSAELQISSSGCGRSKARWIRCGLWTGRKQSSTCVKPGWTATLHLQITHPTTPLGDVAHPEHSIRYGHTKTKRAKGKRANVSTESVSVLGRAAPLGGCVSRLKQYSAPTTGHGIRANLCVGLDR